MFYKLAEPYALRGWERLPNTLVNLDTGHMRAIRPVEMEALRLCDGSIDTSLAILPKMLRDMLPAFEQLGMIKPCAHGDTISPKQEYRRYPARYIRQVHWSITGRCNYRCRHCYMSAPDARLGELDRETVLDIVRQLSECGVMNVSLTGGEPLLRTDFLDIVDALESGGIHIRTIYTNGSLVSESLLDALEGRGLRPEFNMSYDGAGHHDWLRGVQGAQDAVEKAFRLCERRGFPTGAEMCIHQGNMDSLAATVRRLASLGCRSLKTNPVANVGAWKEGDNGEAIGMDELFHLYLGYIPQFYEDGMPLAIQLGGFFSASPSRPDEYDIPLLKNCPDPGTTCLCGHARLHMYISPEGRVLPCMSLSGMDIQQQFPRIQDLGLSACLTDSFYMRFISTTGAEYFERNPECDACAFRAQCLGGCRASGIERSPDDLLAKDPYACALLRGGWPVRIADAVSRVQRRATCAIPLDALDGA